MTDSTLSTYTAADGDNIALQDWPLGSGVRLRGVVVLVHGLGEHAGRYNHVAEFLNRLGFAVRGYDQYGHGESGGQRGGIPSDTRLLDDLADVVGSTRVRVPPGVPLILLGHSMGGLVAARHVSMGLSGVDGLVLSSPALNPGLSAAQRLALAVLPRVAPDLSVGNGLNDELLSHDMEVVHAYRRDRFVHRRISGRLARFIAEAGPATIALAPRWQVPTLLMFAGADGLVDPSGSRAFAAAAPPAIVTTRCFHDLYHEIFNEIDSAEVFLTLRDWLDRYFP